MNTWKHIRIFVSSTFKDMDVERDALRTIVEPRVNRYLKKYMLSVEFVDLRHSVKTDLKVGMEERERQICAVCLDEIDRCTPYFIGLLGHRYGWIPPRGIFEDASGNGNVFNIGCESLSVTAREFLRGLFGDNSHARGLVFMRDESSYINLPKEELRDFVDEGEQREFQKRIRDYVAKSDNVYAVEYAIDLASAGSDAIAQWVDMAYNAVLRMMSPACEARETDDELENFIAAQEAYVQNKIRTFKGRRKELDECRQKLEERGNCIIAAREEGVGVRSLQCKLYDEYRADDNNVCLFYAPEANSQVISLDDVTYYWMLWLDREYIHEGVIFYDRKREKYEIRGKLETYVRMLIERGKQVCAFVVSTDNISNIMDTSVVKSCSVCLYDDLVRFLRPMMYILEPYRKETVSTIVEPLRPQVRQRLLAHPRCSHASWLNYVMTLLDHMNRLDYLSIRNLGCDDNEQNIVDHQLQMIDNFPEDEEEMLQQWIVKVRENLGKGIVDKIIFVLGLSDIGLTSAECAEVVGCTPLEFSIACNILGTEIVCEDNNGFLSLKNWNIWKGTYIKMLFEDKRGVIANASRCMRKPGAERLRAELELKLCMLTHDILEFAGILTRDDRRFRQVPENISNDFYWVAETMPEEFRVFIHYLTESKTTFSYTFVYNLIQCVKKLFADDKFDIYGYTLFQMKHWLRSLWQQGLTDSATYSMLADILACETDLLCEQRRYNEFFDSLQSGLLLSEEQMKDEPLWTKGYLFFIFRKMHALRPEQRTDVLRDTFLQKEKLSLIKIPEWDDATLYAIMLVDAAQYYAAKEDEMASEMAKKAMDIFVHLLEMNEKGQLETVLRPIDFMRNLLYNLYQIIYLYEHAAVEVVNEEWLLRKGWEIIGLCKVVSTDYEDDPAYFYYYNIIGKLIRFSNESSGECIVKLYESLFEIYGDVGRLAFDMVHRNMSVATPDFAAFLSLMAEILLHLSTFEELEYYNPELTARISEKFVRGKIRDGLGLDNDDADTFLDNNDTLCFDDELRGLLPLIGAKKTGDDGLMPELLKPSMLLLYEVMINVELGKAAPDKEKIVRLYNSLSAEADAEYGNLLVPYTLTNIGDADLFDEIIEECRDIEDRYDDFDDCFGISGDIYSGEDGMWVNGDPMFNLQLEIIDTPNEYSWGRSKLEEHIKNSDYAAIIEEFGESERLSVYEAYYLALAYLRTDRFDEAYDVLDVLIATELSDDVISDGEIFSVITNFLIAALLSNHYEEYEQVYNGLNPEDYKDDDIIEIHQYYLQAKEEGDFNTVMPKPYGYMI